MPNLRLLLFTLDLGRRGSAVNLCSSSLPSCPPCLGVVGLFSSRWCVFNSAAIAILPPARNLILDGAFARVGTLEGFRGILRAH